MFVGCSLRPQEQGEVGPQVKMHTTLGGTVPKANCGDPVGELVNYVVTEMTSFSSVHVPRRPD